SREDIGWGGPVAAFATPMEVSRRTIQRKDQSRLFNRRRCVAKVLFSEYRRLELFLRRALPEKLYIDVGRLILCFFEQLRRLGLFELKKNDRVLDLAAFARLGFDLHGRIAARENPCGFERAAFFIKDVHD